MFFESKKKHYTSKQSRDKKYFKIKNKILYHEKYKKKLFIIVKHDMYKKHYLKTYGALSNG